jgi:hypothetical protein
MALFEKGKSGNPSGKPKGALNKVTNDIKETFNNLLNNNIDHVQSALDRLKEEDPKEFLNYLFKIIDRLYPNGFDASSGSRGLTIKWGGKVNNE